VIEFIRFINFLVCFIFKGNSLRLCSNFSYIALSVSRFYLSTSKTSRILKRLEKFSLSKFYASLVLACVLLSLFKVFQFRTNEQYATFDKNFPYDAYGINYCEFNIYSFASFSAQCQLFYILNLLNNIFNNIIFIFLSVIIDISLIRFTNQYLKSKVNLIKDEKHLYDIVKYKQKLNKMIITNGSLYFFSHVPEFLVTIMLIAYRKRLAQFCYFFFTCAELIEMAQAFSFVSVGAQFFIFLYFDHNFKESLMDLIKRPRPKKDFKNG
jgi:hypothetical protein